MPQPVPLSCGNWSAWLRRSPVFAGLARAIAQREGWPRDPWQWTALQRGQARAEIMARLDILVFTIPRATNGEVDATLPSVRPLGRAGEAPPRHEAPC